MTDTATTQFIAARRIGRREGLEQGRAEGREQALAEVDAFVAQLLAIIPNTEAVAHHPMCYVKHPRCAALAVARRIHQIRRAAQ